MKGNLFNSIQVRAPKRNLFDMGHDVKMSMKFGYLYPCLVMETIPGDKFQISGECLGRFMPLSAPIMHECDITIDYWYVPKRVVWPDWDQWILSTPGAPAHPWLTADGSNCQVGMLADYLGLPTATGGGFNRVSAFPFAMVQAIWNEFYRDQNLQASIDWKLIAGDNTASSQLYNLRKRAWQHDYLTSALPFAQKSVPVDIPIGSVEYDPSPTLLNPQWKNVGTNTGAATGNIIDAAGGGIESTGAAGTKVAYDPEGTLIVDPTTITDLRRAFKLQEWRELAARVGTRIKEALKGFFNVDAQDARLDLPEFITSVKSKVNISEVLNNTGTDDAPQGTMAGHGIAYAKGRYGSYYCPEHGYIIGLASCRPKTAYSQGIEKHWTKIDDPYEHFWQQFEHIGEQAIRNQEVFAQYDQSTTNVDGEVWGYIPRYAEYKFMNSRIAGDFKTSLNDWHLAREFAVLPPLNADFIECDPDANRVFAAGDSTDYILMNIRHHIMKISGMSKFGTPSF